MGFLVLTVAGAFGCAARALARDLMLRAGLEAWVVILGVNLVGAAALGAVMSFDGRWDASTIRAGAGFLAGWTTYSAFAVDTVLLWQRGKRMAAVACWAITVLGTPLAACAGYWSLAASAAGATP